jgi:hypothetical protein
VFLIARENFYVEQLNDMVFGQRIPELYGFLYLV